MDTSLRIDISDMISKIRVFATSDTLGSISDTLVSVPAWLSSELSEIVPMSSCARSRGAGWMFSRAALTVGGEGILAVTLVGDGRWSLADGGGEEMGEMIWSGVSKSPSHILSFGQSGSWVKGDPPGPSMLMDCHSCPSMTGLRSRISW